MSIIFKTEERRVIPRLRSFELSNSTGELTLTGNNSKHIQLINRKKFLEEQLAVWNKNKNIAFAGDILSSAYVLGELNEFQEIAKFILDRSLAETDPLTKLARNYISVKDNPILLAEEIAATENNRQNIRQQKNALITEPKNPIAWMELGRLYALEGQLIKANRAVDNALLLDKNNRFIVRSASRFYHHFGHDTEKSLHTIRKADFFKNDPWLLSAEIAYSQILNRFSKMIKVSESYVKSHNGEFFSISELTSALGTYEFKNGSIKDAKKYFTQALRYPTDNSLAQVNWAAENINGFNVDTLKYEVPLAFEAKTIYFFESGDFENAYKEALKWQEDEPFSVRPIKAASYILGFFYKDYKASVELTRKGLKIKPNDLILSNNIVFYLIQSGQNEEAFKIFETDLQMVISNPENYSESEQMYCNATTGLVYYKKGLLDLGKFFYSKAIEIAKKTKHPYLIALATINYVRAALTSDISDDEAESLVKQLRETCRNNQEEDIKFIYNEILQGYHDRVNSNS